MRFGYLPRLPLEAGDRAIYCALAVINLHTCVCRTGCSCFQGACGDNPLFIGGKPVVRVKEQPVYICLRAAPQPRPVGGLHGSPFVRTRFCPYCTARLHVREESTAFEYSAFISYRHLPRDQEIAKRIQRAVETYRLPRSISKSSGPGLRLGKCFRDEDELAAAHSLPERILDALMKSSSLVVVCTPDAAGSIWVEREVTAFIGMHGRERVFTVLAQGSSAESIPEYLKASVALPDGDGRLFTLPYPVRWARITHCDSYDVLLAIPVDSNNRIVSFRTNWAREASGEPDRPLDELLAQAEQVLADGGRTR